MMPSPRPDPEVTRVKKVARVLDHFLVDPILGLIVPGAGDLAGSLLGLYTVGLALRRRISPIVIARMLLNLSIDAALGVVPFLGDMFDFGFKANQRNVQLLGDRSAHGGRATARDWLVVVGAALLFFGTIALAAYAVVALFRAVF